MTADEKTERLSRPQRAARRILEWRQRMVVSLEMVEFTRGLSGRRMVEAVECEVCDVPAHWPCRGVADGHVHMARLRALDRAARGA